MKPFLHGILAPILLALVVSGNTLAQQTQGELLLDRISKENNDTSKIKLMVQYLMYYAPIPEDKMWYDKIQALSKKTNFRQGLLYYRLYEGLQLSEQGKFDEAIARVKSCIEGLDSLHVIQSYGYPLYQLRFIYIQAGRQIDMFRYYTDKVVYYKRYGPIENTSACYHSLGIYYHHLADYDKAIGYFMRALEAYKPFDPLGVMNETMAIGFAYLDWGNLYKAELYLKTELNNEMHIYSIYNIDYYDPLGDLYFAKKNYRRALQCYLEQKKTVLKMHHFFQANNMLKIASAYLHMGANDSARAYLESADKIRQKEETNIYFENNFGDIDFGYYEFYHATGDQKLALQCLETAMGKARLSKDIGTVLKYTNELHSFFLEQGDSIRALRYLVQYHSLQDSLNVINTQARIASFEIEQQAQGRENEIENLQSQKTTQRNYYLVAGVVLLLIVFGVINRLLYRRKRDREQLTTEFKRQLAQAETTALRAQMNPHFIFNCLNSINSFVLEQKHEVASDYLIKFSKLIRLILDNSRCESVPLEKELETLKLYVLLESARFDNKFSCIYHIAAEVNANSVMIPPMLLQPFVENAIWHGLMQKETEGTIVVEIKKENEEFLNISITDDGIGRQKAAELKSKSATHKSHGLKVTSQRIEMMNKLSSTGARVHIIDLKDESGRATGTRVELIIPV
jgi:tetratricopeptide (TPR) repeat protein